MIGPSEPLAAEPADAAEHFVRWRRTRTKSSEPILIDLRERAVALLAARRPYSVAGVLGADSVMLERRSCSPEEARRERPRRFIALPEIPSESAAQEPPDVIAATDLSGLALRWPGGREIVARDGPLKRA